MDIYGYLNSLATNELFGLFLIFTRMAGALGFFPGFGENYVNGRAKVGFAILMALVVAPILLPQMPVYPGSALQIAVLVLMEALVGIFYGLLARLLFLSIEIGGTIMSFQMSLGNATIFNPAMASQGSLVSVFFIVMATTLLFVTDMHHLMLAAIVGSYDAFPPGQMPPTGDMAEYFSRAMSASFLLAAQFASPLLVLGVLFYTALGVLGRLMPQMQVFFVAIPLQILMGFFVMALTLSAVFMWFLMHYENLLEDFLQ